MWCNLGEGRLTKRSLEDLFVLYVERFKGVEGEGEGEGEGKHFRVDQRTCRSTVIGKGEE